MNDIRICPKCGKENNWHELYYGKGYPEDIIGFCRGAYRCACCENCAYNFDTGKIDKDMMKRALEYPF